MNTYPRHLFWQIDTRLLWLALIFIVISGVYNTYMQMTSAGLAITNNAPAALKSPINEARATPKPKNPPPTQTAAVITTTSLPPYNKFPENSTDLGRKINSVWFGEAHWPALHMLWTRESNWNPNARNRSSGACGIPQALPCSKITDMTPRGQIEWGLSYIERRYKNPTNAWRHFQSRGWY